MHRIRSATKKMKEIFSSLEKSKYWVQKEKGCSDNEIQEVHEEWRRKYALMNNRELSAWCLGIIVGNEFIASRQKLMNWLNNSTYRQYMTVEGNSVENQR